MRPGLGAEAGVRGLGVKAGDKHGCQRQGDYYAESMLNRILGAELTSAQQRALEHGGEQSEEQDARQRDVHVQAHEHRSKQRRHRRRAAPAAPQQRRRTLRR